MTPLRTPRLVLRNWEERDRDLFHRVNSDDQVMEFFPFRRDRATSDAVMDRMRAEIDADGYGWTAAEIADTGEGSADAILPALRSAMEDDGAKALVLLINSPGGSPVQAGLVHDEILRLRKLHDKPVYTVVEESCASAAYYIAAASDQIFVDKASLVGSIGVLINGFGFVGTLDKLGVERRLMTAGENKGFLDPFSPQSDKHREHAQKMLDQIHQQFIAVVRKGRGDRLKETPETFSGLFWTGEQAVQMGLADHLGSVDSVARDVVKAEKLIDYTNKENIAERFAKRFGAAAGQGAVAALRAVPGLR